MIEQETCPTCHTNGSYVYPCQYCQEPTCTNCNHCFYGYGSTYGYLCPTCSAFVCDNHGKMTEEEIKKIIDVRGVHA